MAKNPRVNLTVRDSEGWTPLHVAAHNGLDSIVRIFCSSGVHVDEQVIPPLYKRSRESGCTAIHLAVMKDHRPVIEFLVKAGANLSQKWICHLGLDVYIGIDCLGLAAKYANHDLVKYFLNRKHFERESMARALLDALIKTCDRLYLYYERKWIHGCDQREPLTEDRFATVQLLLNAGADVSACCHYGVPILNHTRSVEMASIFLNAAKNNGIKAAGYTQEQVSPLDYLLLRYENLESPFWDRVPLALLYIENGFKINYNASAGWNAFHKAIERGYMPVISAILERQESLIHSRDEVGNTGLHLAAQYHRGLDRLACVKLLLKYGSDIRAVNEKGETVLHSAFKDINPQVATETLAVTKYLVQAGVDIYARAKDKRAAFHEAVLNGHSQAASFLLEQAGTKSMWFGDYPLGLDPSGNTSLHIAITTGCIEVAERLIEMRAYVSTVNNVGDTTIYAAVQKAIVKHGKAPEYLQTVKQILLGDEVPIEAFEEGPHVDGLSKTGYLRIIKQLRCLREADVRRKNFMGLAAIDLVGDCTWETTSSILEGARLSSKWRRLDRGKGEPREDW